MDTSTKGIDFIHRQEGFPLTAYLDPVGIPTIGPGFTLRSPAVKRELAKIGITKLVPGKTKLTKAQADTIFLAVLDTEFEQYVDTFVKKLPDNVTVTQGMYDAMVSATFNLGPGFLGWKWNVPILSKGDKKGSASIWAVNYNKAAGKTLPGLVRRRKEEANLFLTGSYGAGTAMKVEAAVKPKTPDEDVKAAQEALTKAGIPVTADGWLGPKTTAAVKRYQSMHPHLVADGVLGPATIAQLHKDTVAAKDIAKKALPLTGLTGAVSTGAGLPWGWIAAAVGIVAVGAVIYFGWRYRDVIQRKLNASKVPA